MIFFSRAQSAVAFRGLPDGRPCGLLRTTPRSRPFIGVCPH